MPCNSKISVVMEGNTSGVMVACAAYIGLYKQDYSTVGGLPYNWCPYDQIEYISSDTFLAGDLYYIRVTGGTWNSEYQKGDYVLTVTVTTHCPVY